MKTTLKPDLESNTYCISKGYSRLTKKEINLINIRFYQKLFIVIISMSTFLIFPESPRELENICNYYNGLILNLR